MTDEALKKIILDAVETEDGKTRLSCKKAHDISYEYDISLGRIGKICNANEIRIKGCQLGCF